jgi:hypothetical protein
VPLLRSLTVAALIREPVPFFILNRVGHLRTMATGGSMDGKCRFGAETSMIAVRPVRSLIPACRDGSDLARR